MEDGFHTGDDVIHQRREEIDDLELEFAQQGQGLAGHLAVGDALALAAAVADVLQDAHAPRLLDIAEARADFLMEFAHIVENLPVFRIVQIA